MRHVSVLTMLDRTILHDHAVIIEGSQVTAVIPEAQMAADFAGLSIEAPAKYLLPGLADMHVHIWGEPSVGSLYVANGITTVRNMWGNETHFDWRKNYESAESPGPRVFTTGPVIDGVDQNGRPSWLGATVVVDPDAADAIVRQHADAGYDQIKVYSLLTPAVFRAIAKTCREIGIDMVGHCPNELSWEEAMAEGMRCFEHLENLIWLHVKRRPTPWEEEGPAAYLNSLCDVIDLDAVARLGDQMARNDVWCCPTRVVERGRQFQYARKRPDSLEGFELMELQQSEDWELVDDKNLIGPDVANALARWNEVQLEIVKVLHDQGAKLLSGSDAPVPYVVHGYALHDEIDLLRQAGLDKFDVLQTATSRPADFMRASGSWGTIQAGASADLICADGNPLDDLSVMPGLMGCFSAADISTGPLFAICSYPVAKRFSANSTGTHWAVFSCSVAATPAAESHRRGSSRHRFRCRGGI